MYTTAAMVVLADITTQAPEMKISIQANYIS